MIGMGSQNKPYRRSTQEIKCKSLCNDTKGKRNSQPVARQTIKSQVNSKIKVKICGTVFLHSKKRQFIMVGSGLQETKSSHHQR